jgi:SPP1 gp7 family putative phage head morphogenesis protein
VVEYTGLLREVLGGVDRELHAVLAREGLVGPRQDATSTRADMGDPPYPRLALDRIRRELERAVGRALSPRALDEGLRRIAGRVGSWSREQFSKQVKAALGVDLPATDIGLAAKIEGFREQNVALIRSLVSSQVERVHMILAEAGSGTRVETIAKRLLEATDATPARAALIARDQILKLNSEVTQDRHRAAGVTEYTWSTSRDERVRPAHKALEGTRHRYDDPPVVDPKTGRRAHPGQDYQCRCTADPVIEGFDEPSGAGTG